MKLFDSKGYARVKPKGTVYDKQLDAYLQWVNTYENDLNCDY